MIRTKSLVTLLLFALAPPANADPGISIVAEGLQGGNWVWRVDIVPDFSLVPPGEGTPVALELGFRLTDAQLISATNINPSEFDLANPGNVIFGWETLDPMANNHPTGLQVNTATGEIFAAFGSVNLVTPGAKPFLEIVSEGPTGYGTYSNTLQWLGAYNGNGRIAQIIPLGAGNFDIISGFVTGSLTQSATVVPEPATGILAAIGAVLTMALCSRRTDERSRPLSH